MPILSKLFFSKICSSSINYNSFVQYFAPSHHNNNHWIILNWSFRNKFHWILNENTMVITKNSLETLQNVIHFKASMCHQNYPPEVSIILILGEMTVTSPEIYAINCTQLYNYFRMPLTFLYSTLSSHLMQYPHSRVKYWVSIQGF